MLNDQIDLTRSFFKLVEYSQDVYWLRDPSFSVLHYVSHAYEAVWGRTCDSLYRQSDSWLTSLHPLDRDRIKTELQAIKIAAHKKDQYVLQYRIVHLDNDIRNIQEIILPLYNKDNELLGFSGIAKNTTQRKLILAELEQASHFFRFFAERVHAVFWARDESCNKQLYLSPGYEKVWGRSRAVLYERPDSWIETLHPEDREAACNLTRFETLSEMGVDAEYEYRYRIYTPEGELRWIKDVSFPIYDDLNKFIGFAGIAEDITKEVTREQKLTDAISRAEVANRAKSDFLAMVSHELRTPLNAILGMTQILKMKGLSQELDESIEIISNAGTNLLSLVNDILDFARLEVGKLSFLDHPFDLRKLFMQIMQSLRYQVEDKGIEFIFEFAESIPRLVIGDANRIRQVLMNLIVNAIKFTDTGYIKVSVDCDGAFSKTDAIFKVRVEDTGIGISQDKLITIFEKFNQVDSIYHRKHGGIGLGLAIAKQLVEAMDGTIQVRSEYGQGSEFSFRLPLKLQTLTQPLMQENKMNITMKTRSRYSLRVLLVEDNLINQKIVRMMLEACGCSVDIVDNGQTVMERLNELSCYDLILMDVGLPDMSGFDVVCRIRKVPALKNICIVAVTAHILERDRVQALESGIARIVAKPISFAELEEVLQECQKVRYNVN